MKVCIVKLDNYCGECAFELYDSKAKAVMAVRRLYKEALEEEYKELEYDREENTCSWFDPSYNEYSTYVSIEESEVF